MEPDVLGSGTAFSRKSFFFSKDGDYIVRTTNWSKVTKEYHSNKYMCMVSKQQISKKRKQEIMRRFKKLPSFSTNPLNFVVGNTIKIDSRTICPFFVVRSQFLCSWFWKWLLILSHFEVSFCCRHVGVFILIYITVWSDFLFFYACRLQFLIFFPSLNGLSCLFTFFFLYGIYSSSFFLFQLTFTQTQEVLVFC